MAGVLDLPCEDDRFGAVIVESVLGFVEDKSRAIRECIRVTRSGGYVGWNESLWMKDPSPEMITLVKDSIRSDSIPTKEGWLYLVTVLDLYSRMIVGWAMSEQHDAKLAKSALEMAIQRQKPTAGLILHPNKGGEFANALYAATANTAQMQRSMSGTGNCYDNAVFCIQPCTR